ncbi:hypothetical protein QFZ30_003122 [Arthrobacter pascens]|uniref:hypothetical protein n=1 Tax=Arthrobacter pascens TaxID=1677 RepID=UPI002792152E|nr:hypothetical protein [Arthrobacter pascens]MDQ0679740.1 hypothetical protein [Arthrobacter pascens]
MNSPTQEPWIITGFNSEQWHERPRVFSVFLVTAFIGFFVSLFLLLLIPGFRSPAAVLLFVSTCATICTPLLIAAQLSVEEAFLSRFTEKVNGTILELTGSRSDSLTARQVRALIENGEALPLLVNGVPGLDLRFIREQAWDKRKADDPQPIRTMFTVERLRAVLRSGGRQLLMEMAGRLSVLLGNVPRRMFQEFRAKEMFSNTKAASLGTYLVITTVSPDYGTTSFDRLVSALTDAGRAKG